MEVFATIRGGEVGRCLERSWWGEACDTHLLKGVRSNRFVELSITGIGSVHGLEWDQFDGVRGQVGCMLLLDFTGYRAMLEFVQGAFLGGADKPRTSECVLQIVHLLFGGAGLYSTMCKHNIANRVHPRVRAAGIDKLAMVRPLFLDEKLGDLAAHG